MSTVYCLLSIVYCLLVLSSVNAWNNLDEHRRDVLPSRALRNRNLLIGNSPLVYHCLLSFCLLCHLDEHGRNVLPSSRDDELFDAPCDVHEAAVCPIPTKKKKGVRRGRRHENGQQPSGG